APSSLLANNRSSTHFPALENRLGASLSAIPADIPISSGQAVEDAQDYPIRTLTGYGTLRPRRLFPILSATSATALVACPYLVVADKSACLLVTRQRN